MNFAHISNLVFERDDGESVPDFRARVRATVVDLGGGVLAWGAPELLEWVEGAPEVIDIEGGLKDDATGDFATAGDVLVEREDGELIEAFRARACEGVWPWQQSRCLRRTDACEVRRRTNLTET